MVFEEGVMIFFSIGTDRSCTKAADSIVVEVESVVEACGLSLSIGFSVGSSDIFDDDDLLYSLMNIKDKSMRLNCEII